MTRTRTFFLGGLAVALVLAGVVSNWASSNPDGLDKVSQDLGFDSTATDHAAASSPLADYTTKGVENEWLSTLVSGVTGVVITLAIGGLLFLALRRRDGAKDAASSSPDRTTTPSG